MGDRFDRIEGRLEHLEIVVDDPTRRLHSLQEERRALGAMPRLAPAAPAGMGAAMAPAADVTRVLSLAGRTFVVFAGAYFLRALTESGTVSGPAGITLGLLYAAVWMVLADRTGAADRLGGELHGAAALTIALPLLWEACTTRQLIPPVGGAVALVGVSIAGLFVAWRRKLHGLAWVATIGALVAGVGLLFVTKAVAAYAVFFVVLGIATLWLGYDRGWYGLRWPAALVADLAIVGLTSRALTQGTGEPPATAIAVQLLLLSTYLTTIAARTLVRRRSVIPFEVAQGAATLAVGLGGAMAVTASTGVGGQVLGLGALLLGAGSYVVAFAFVARRRDPSVNFYFYTSVGLVLTLAGSQRILAPDVLVMTWGAVAWLAAWSGHRFERTTLAAHAAVFATAAAFMSGLVPVAAAALLSSSADWTAFSWPALVTLFLVAACLLTRAPASAESRPARRIPRLVIAVLLTIAIAGLAASVLAAAVADSPADRHDALPTVRTAVIAALAIAVAFVGRYPRWVEFGWLVYPLLIAGTAKLLVDDLRHSPASMLVIALGLYGGALIAAPRVSRPRTAARERSRRSPSVLSG